MKIKITQNGLAIEREIPVRWEEVTFKQFLAIAECKNEREMFAALAGVDLKTLEKAKVKGADKVIAILQFLNQKPQISELPKKIMGYTIPQNLEFEEIQIYEDLKSELREAEKTKEGIEGLKRYPLYVAMFVCEQVYGSYNYKRAEQLAATFMNAPAVEVLAVGNFTILKLIGLKNGISIDLSPPLTRWRKSKLALISWLKTLAFTVRYYTWRRKHLSSGTN